MSTPFTPSRRLVERMINLAGRLERAWAGMFEIEAAARRSPVSPERMAAATTLLREARRLLSRHRLSAALPRLRPAPSLTAGELCVELTKALRIVHEICAPVADLSPPPRAVR